MGDTGDRTEIEQQLLMAAAVLGLGPDTNLGRANTVKIVNRVLGWRGLSDEQIASGWRGEDCDQSHKEVYSALIRMTHREGPGRPPERPGPALFEGLGNWGVPGDRDRPACWPHYNSCRLTAGGERMARLLLEELTRLRHGDLYLCQIPWTIGS